MKIVSENQFSGKIYFYTIASRLLAAVKHHARAANADKLREILNDLMGTKEEGWSPTVRRTLIGLTFPPKSIFIIVDHIICQFNNGLIKEHLT